GGVGISGLPHLPRSAGEERRGGQARQSRAESRGVESRRSAGAPSRGLRVPGAVTPLLRRLQEVRLRIASAVARSGRDLASVSLVAVSKTVPPETVRQLLAAGPGDPRPTPGHGTPAQSR